MAHLHVFHWIGEHDKRLPLFEGATDWTTYFAAAAEAAGDRCAYLEFIRGDAEAAFIEDAAELRRLLATSAVLDGRSSPAA